MFLLRCGIQEEMEDRGAADGQHLIQDKVRSPPSSSEAALTQSAIKVTFATAARRLVGKTVRAVLNIQS
jgi:hypothetical protein